MNLNVGPEKQSVCVSVSADMDNNKSFVSSRPKSINRRLLDRRVFVVLASFFIHFIVDGVTYSFGVLVPTIVQHFDSNYSTVAGIGALLLAVTWFSGPTVSHLTNKFGYRVVAFSGALTTCIGFFLSHFLFDVWVLYLCISVVSGFGMGMLYLPAIVSLSDHFNRWKTLATGIAMSGSGIGTFLFAPVTALFLDHYSLSGSLLMNSALLANCCVFGLLIIPTMQTKKPTVVSGYASTLNQKNECETNEKKLRKLEDLEEPLIETTEMIHPQQIRHESNSTPVAKDIKNNTAHDNVIGNDAILTVKESHTESHPHISRRSKSSQKHSSKMKCLKSITNHPSLRTKVLLLSQGSFLIMAVSNFLTCLGYGVPYIFLPDLAIRSGVTPHDAAFLISVIGICNTISKVLSGCLSDVIQRHRFMLYTAVVAMCGLVGLFIELFVNYISLMIFSVIFGVMMGACTCLIPIVLGDLYGTDKLSDSFGLMLFFQGLGTGIGPPLAGWLYDQTADYKYSFYFFGGTMLLSGMILLFIPLLHQCKETKEAAEENSTEKTDV